MKIKYGELAQLVEHLLCTQGVRSSSLLFSTIYKKTELNWSFFIVIIEFHIVRVKIKKYLKNYNIAEI